VDTAAQAKKQDVPQVVLLGWHGREAGQALSLPVTSYQLPVDGVGGERMVLTVWQTPVEKPKVGGDVDAGKDVAGDEVKAEDSQTPDAKKAEAEQDLKFRYAAVPYGDGWLIVQL
jgi:hypothetical protein